MTLKFVGIAALVAVVLAAIGCAQKTDAPTDASTVSQTTTTDGVQKATITIDGGKYSPSTVSVEKGKPVELTFTGGKELGCGGTIVFKSLNQTKDVKSGESVTFAFTPDKAGDIPFTCGMDMYDGKVVVK